MERRKLDILPQCLSISFKRKSNISRSITGEDLFKRFIAANSCFYWNLNLKEVIENCQLLGYLKPYCLLIGAQDLYIQSIKIAYKKRLLKAPESFYINYFGDINPIQCQSILPSQFVSLDESLCYIIYDLNLNGVTSSFDMICSRLAEWYPTLQLPPQFLILATLRNLLEANQVYYTGYGYNIMTSDKQTVAHWLGQQDPDRPDNTIGLSEDRNSTSELSEEDLTDSRANSKTNKFDCDRKETMRMPYNPIDKANSFHLASSMPPYFGPTDNSKAIKTRSAVKEFFSKLKPRPHKSRPPSSTARELNINNFYEEEYPYYSYSKSQPVFISTNADFSARYSELDKEPFGNDANPHHQKWLWNSSLQSVSNLNSSNSCRKSVSSHSKLSTLAIHDDSPPNKSSSSIWKRYSKVRYSRQRDKSAHSSKTERSSSGEYKNIDYLVNELPQEDSGVHSNSGSHGKMTSDNSIKARRHTSHQRYRSLELDPDINIERNLAISPPFTNSDSKAYQRLTRSFSTRLSTLNPVVEGYKRTSQDRHVMFQEHSGTIHFFFSFTINPHPKFW